MALGTLCRIALAVILGALLALTGVEITASEVSTVDVVRVRTSASPTTVTATRRVYASGADLPDGPPVPDSGSGRWEVVPGTSEVVGQGRLYTYAVEVEQGLAVDGGAFGSVVQEVLSDPRGWTARGDVSFRRVDVGAAAIRIRLTSPTTARALCGFEIPVDVSCRIGGVVYLSAARWVRGAVAYDGDLTGYRRYVVNHEVGHALGEGHKPCAVDGGPAPVMLQQTFGTANDEIARLTGTGPVDGRACRPNPWPFPG